MKKIIAIVALLAAGCTVNLGQGEAAPPPVQEARQEFDSDLSPAEEREMQMFYEEFYGSPLSDQREFCELFPRVPPRIAHEVYENAFGVNSFFTPDEFAVMAEVACEGVGTTT